MKVIRFRAKLREVPKAVAMAHMESHSIGMRTTDDIRMLSRTVARTIRTLTSDAKEA